MSKGNGGTRNQSPVVYAEDYINGLQDNGWVIKSDNREVYDINELNVNQFDNFDNLNLKEFDFDRYKNTITDYFNELGLKKPKFRINFVGDRVKIEFENEQVACFRDIMIGKDGKLVAYQTYLDINEKYQEKGIAPLIYRMNIDDYRKMGIEKVKMLANLDVGGYAWAKYGFSASKKDVESMIARNFNEVNDPKARKIVNDYYKTHDTKENFPMNLLSQFKDELLGTQWSGQLNLKDRKQMKVFEDYLSERERKYGLK